MFKHWLKYPQKDQYCKEYFRYPTNILCLSDGFVAIIEYKRLHILDRYLRPRQYIVGDYFGLAEGEKKEILTIEKMKGVFRVSKYPRYRGYYKIKWAMYASLTVVQDFDNWESLSKPRFIEYDGNKIFVTDKGLHKIYIIDYKSGNQSASGYLGPNPGQFKCPTGIMCDDAGNILVLDSGNNQLQVYTSSGEFVKTIGNIEYRFVSPQGVCRVEDSIFVAFKGGKYGAVVHYRLNDFSN